jgi:hypothetical protein
LVIAGQRQAQLAACFGLKKTCIPVPSSARTVHAVMRSTPGMVHKRAT